MPISPSNTSPYQLRLRPLPRPEYRLMKALVKQYNLTDESELFGVALRLLHEVGRYNNGAGTDWIHHVIDSYRTLPDSTRTQDYTPE